MNDHLTNSIIEINVLSRQKYDESVWFTPDCHTFIEDMKRIITLTYMSSSILPQWVISDMIGDEDVSICGYLTLKITILYGHI